MSVKDIDLFVALAAISNLVEKTSDGQDVLAKETTTEDLNLIDAYVEQAVDKAEVAGEDVLMAAIAVIKAKINELKETKE